MPIFSSKIQSEFKLKNEIICYDLPGSCSGFTNGLIHAYSFIKSGLAKKVLLICADVHSYNLKDKNLVPIISDGVSCIMIKKGKNFFYSDFGVDGKNSKILIKKSGYGSLKMIGAKVLEFAIKRVPLSIKKVIKKSKKNIDYFCIHQPNQSMFNLLIQKIGIHLQKVIPCSNYGNTSSPSIPISMSNYFNNKIIKNKIIIPTINKSIMI